MTETVSLRTKRLTDSWVPTEINLSCIDMEMVGVSRGQKSRPRRVDPSPKTLVTTGGTHRVSEANCLNDIQGMDSVLVATFVESRCGAVV
jgi:hypothetical protein